MELDELKTKWRELDERLDRTEAKMRSMAAEITAGRLTSAKQRLTRTFRITAVLPLLLPGCFMWIFRLLGADPGIAVHVLLGLFFVAILVRQIILLRMLSKIDPGTMSVRDACAAVLRLRKVFLGGVIAGAVLAVPLLIALGIFFSTFVQSSLLYGFASGLIAGALVGVKVFLRISGEINAMRDALRDTGDEA